MSGMLMIDLAVVVGVAVVLPLVTLLGWWWPVAAGLAALAFAFRPGPVAATLAAAWPAAAAWSLWRIARRSHPDRPSIDVATRLLMAAYALVAGTAFVASRGGLRLVGVGEPIVELTSVHFTFAGAAALALASGAASGAPGRLRPLGIAAQVLTAAGPPIVATGFVAGLAVAQVGGAVVMALGVVSTGALELAAAADRRLRFGPRVLLGISGASIWVPMGLAVAWAAGQHWDVPALSLPDMARAHGSVNAAGFVLCGLWGRGLARRDAAAAASRAIDATATVDPTYDHVGSTLDPQHWPDRRPFVRSRVVGHGQAAFDAATDGLRSWACHRGIRARVHPPDAPLAVGTTLAVELPVGPIRIIVPNRVVAVVDEPDRFGFAYGTLPGHQERGEEGFEVTRSGDGTVTATVRVDAVPATRAARLGAPLVTLVQHVAVGRYLAAWADHVAPEGC